MIAVGSNPLEYAVLENIIFADVDFLQILIFLVIVISSLVGQFIKGNAERKKRPRPPIKPVDAGDLDQADRERGRLEEEIDSMLRRAIGAEPKEPVEVEVIEPEVVQPHNVDPEIVVLRDQPVQGRRGAGPIPAVLAESVAPKDDSLSNRHIESELEKRTDRFGSDIQKADQRIESRLQNTFDRKLGTLSESSSSLKMSDSSVRMSEPAAQDSGSQSSDAAVADRVVEMLTTPGDLPAAIVLSEIVRRPEW